MKVFPFFHIIHTHIECCSNIVKYTHIYMPHSVLHHAKLTNCQVKSIVLVNFIAKYHKSQIFLRRFHNLYSNTTASEKKDGRIWKRNRGEISFFQDVQTYSKCYVQRPDSKITEIHHGKTEWQNYIQITYPLSIHLATLWFWLNFNKMFLPQLSTLGMLWSISNEFLFIL